MKMLRAVINLFDFSKKNEDEIPEALLPCDWRYDDTKVTDIFVDARILRYVKDNGFPLHGMCEVSKQPCEPIGCTIRDRNDLCEYDPGTLGTQLRHRR